MTSDPVAQAGTELITSDLDLVRTEFEALIGASFDEPARPPAPPAPPVPPAAEPAGPRPEHVPGPVTSIGETGHQPDAAARDPRPPP